MAKKKTAKKTVKKKVGRKKKLNSKELTDALRKHGGLITHTAKTLGCHYHTIQNYINDNEGLAKVCKEIQEELKDLAEYGVFKKIKMIASKEDPTREDLDLLKWYLKHKAKDRGYVERQEFAGADNQPLNVKVEFIDPPEGTPKE